MSLSTETLALVLKGLGGKQLAEGEVIWGRYHSEPVLAAVCKAKLRDVGARYSILAFPNGHTNVDIRWPVGNIRKPANIDRGDGNDDLALIEAFAKAVKEGAL